MSTKLQKDANRKNAKKSTGPKTTEGKAKSSKNAIKHGLTACCNVIEIEDRDEFDFFRHEMLDDLYPIGPMQYRLAERIVSLSWRLRRAEIMHDKTIDDLLQKDTDWLYYDIDQYRTHPDMPDNELALGHMAQSDFSGNRVLDRLIMYERRIENSMYKTIKQLKILKNEPISSSTTERQEPRYQPREVPEENYEKLPISMSPELEKIISRIRKNLKLDEIQESTIENPVSRIEKMQNEPNLQDQTNLTPAITKEYEHALLHGYQPDQPYPPQKPTNQARPKPAPQGADSTNTHGPGRAGNQLKGSISKRNQGRSEAYNHPRRPIRARFNKK